MQIEDYIAITFLILCAVIDIKKRAVSVPVILLFGLAAVLCLGIKEEKDINTILFSLLPGAFLITISLCSRESIGYGDGFAVLVLGLLLGLWKCMDVVIAGFWFSTVCSLVLLLTKKVNGKSRLPFIPFLTVGLVVVLFV